MGSPGDPPASPDLVKNHARRAKVGTHRTRKARRIERRLKNAFVWVFIGLFALSIVGVAIVLSTTQHASQ